MANYTENYGLTLPEETDLYDVEDMNGNFTAVDAALYANEQAMELVGEKIDTTNSRIGTSSSTGTSTLFGQLNSIRNSLSAGSSPIKSLQRVTQSYGSGNTSATITINTVTPAKCLVIAERLQDASNGSAAITYTLSSNKLETSFNSSKGNLGFWIIEFN